MDSQSPGQSLRTARQWVNDGRPLPPPQSFTTQSSPTDPRLQPPPMPKPVFRSTYLNQAELERFENLLVFARTTVEGWMAGRHRSPHYGFSAEFVEHKPYVAGDDIAHIDWQVYARTRRLFSRKYLEETDMSVHLLVDGSPSMAYKGGAREMKHARARRLAAALAYLMQKQGDKASLGLFTDRLVEHIPPGSTRRHLLRLLIALEQTTPNTTSTDVVRALQETAAQVRRRGRLVVISDFLGVDVPAMFDALGVYLHRGCEVMLMQVLEPEEMVLPDVSLARFRDMETGQEVQVEPEEIRAAYEREMQALIETLRAQALRRRIDFSLHNTASPYTQAIEAYMGFRRA